MIWSENYYLLPMSERACVFVCAHQWRIKSISIIWKISVNCRICWIYGIKLCLLAQIVRRIWQKFAIYFDTINEHKLNNFNFRFHIKRTEYNKAKNLTWFDWLIFFLNDEFDELHTFLYSIFLLYWHTYINLDEIWI